MSNDKKKDKVKVVKRKREDAEEDVVLPSSSAILPKISHLDAHSQLIVQVKLMMREREIARKNSDFNKSDTLREKLKGSHFLPYFNFIFQ